MADACILVPVYRETPKVWELLSLENLASKLGHREIRLVAPEGLDTGPYLHLLGDRPVHFFDRRFFASRDSYNALMVHEPLYRAADGFEFMLIHQTDAFVIEDQLDYWVGRGFDFIGAPF